MNRPLPRPAVHVQADPPGSPREETLTPPSSPAARPRWHWGWRVALFVWVTSFAFLLLYAVLADVARAVKRLFG